MPVKCSLEFTLCTVLPRAASNPHVLSITEPSLPAYMKAANSPLTMMKVEDLPETSASIMTLWPWPFLPIFWWKHSYHKEQKTVTQTLKVYAIHQAGVSSVTLVFREPDTSSLSSIHQRSGQGPGNSSPQREAKRKWKATLCFILFNSSKSNPEKMDTIF